MPFPEPKEAQKEGKPKEYKRYKKGEVRVYSRYNMSGWQINNINDLERAATDFYLQSDGQPYRLYQCIEALYRAYMIFRVVLNKGLMAKYDRKFRDLIKETRTMRMTNHLNDNYYRVRDKVNDLTVEYFEIKQKSGVHLEVDKIKDAETALEEVTEG